MSDYVFITCQCGYEIHTPVSTIGTTIECINCGADVVVSKESSRDDRTVHDPGVGTQRNTSKLTLESDEPKIPISPFDPTAPTVSPSAFEDTGNDAFGADTAWKSDDAAPARSPFEDESESVEPIDTKPKPTAPAPRVFTEVTERDTHEEVSEEETCPRCGNPYRGDWDKQITEDGELCYICSNQATEKIPERLRGGPRAEENIPLPDRVVFHKEGKPQFWLFDTQSEGFRRMLWVLAVGTLLLTFYLLQTDDYQSPFEREMAAIERGEQVEEIIAEPTPELPGWANAIYWTWQVIAGIAGIFLTLYLALAFRNRLPHETFKGNFFVIGITSLAMSGVGLFAGACYYFLKDDMFFRLYSLMLGPIIGFSQIFILIRLLGFGLMDFLLALLFFGISQAMVQAFGMFVLWGLASVAL